MRPIVRDFVTGAIAIAGVVGLVAMLGITGELKNLGTTYYDFTVSTDNAGGLSGTSAVFFNGVKVGNVRGVRHDPDPRKGVQVLVHVGSTFKIPRSSQICINQSFVGDVTMEFLLPPDATAADATDFILPNDTLPYQKSVTLFSRITDGIRDPLEKLAGAADGVRGFTDEYTKLGQNLNKLVAPATPGEVDQGAAPTVASVIARADKVLQSADAWVGDDALRTDAKGLVSSAQAAVDKLGQAGDAIKSTAQTVDAQAGKVGDQVGELASSARQTLQSVDQAASDIKSITAGINRGEGTVGQLVKNPDLYASLLDASRRLEKALEEFRLLAEKYRTEGLPIKF
jgi:phospholipid/cholesterol/gamma-HCH transport system substrate-binding protein